MRLACVLACAAALLAAAPAPTEPGIRFERFILANGLRVIVHEDRKAPIVAVHVAYHVGAKDEPESRTGLAHLFEHLLFKVSGNPEMSFQQALENAGATDVNGATTQDSTHYFETVPTPALELALWLESDRMAHSAGRLTQALLDSERGVVQNEKREREGGPAAAAGSRVLEALFPVGHPYRRPVTGSMADLEAASLADAREWFVRHYGAANAVVVLAGDIDAALARELVEKYFSHLPSGEPLGHVKSWVPRLSGEVAEILHARVAQASIEWSWPAPSFASRHGAMLDVAGSVLSGTLTERLRGELVEKRKLATHAVARLDRFEIAGVFSVSVSCRADADTAEIERIVRQVIDDFLEEGPTRPELRRIQGDLEASRLLGMQSVSAKAQALAVSELYAGDPGFGAVMTQWVDHATAEDVRWAAREWLERPAHRLTILPFGEPRAAPAAPGLGAIPEVSGDFELDLPPIQEATLSNGMKVVLAERHAVPALSMTMVFAGAGGDADPADKRGTAAATYALMGNGPRGTTKHSYSERMEELHTGVAMGTGDRDASSSLSVLKKNLRPALALWARTIRAPAFRPEDMEAWRSDTLQDVTNALVDPGAVATRLLNRMLYPTGHPYSPPEDPAAILAAIQLRDLQLFHAERVRPDAATLFVVGDVTLVEVTRELEKAFGGWRALNAPPNAPPAIAPGHVPDTPRFVLVDWPGAEQTRIVAGRFVSPAVDDESRMLNAANGILGGGLGARLGRRLRVENGWSYGIESSLDGRPIQQLWSLSTSVQADVTAESVAEILDVVEAFAGSRPATGAELEQYVAGRSRRLPGLFEDADSVLAAIVQADAYDRPYDWVEGAKARLDSLEVDAVNEVARRYFTPESLAWVLVGDLSRFEQKLRDFGFGSVEVWDRAGNRIR